MFLSLSGSAWATESTPEPIESGIMPLSIENESTWIPYEVVGGNIYFEPETQNIVGIDDTVTEAVVPLKSTASQSGIFIRWRGGIFKRL